jgi:LuxR family maltose regulon positive regulatory protein
MTAINTYADEMTSVAGGGAAHALAATDGSTWGSPVEFVRRPSLVARLAWPGARLAAIVAPPGYGKSTLLAEWEQADARPFVWLTADDCRAGADSPIPELCAREGEFVVVVDPADRVRPRTLHALVDAALNELPAGCAIALASRTEPALPLGRLRGRRMLVEVRTRDLQMGTPEAVALLRAEGVEPTPEELEALLERTEGWPVALLLWTLAVREGSPAAQFGGAHHLVSDYVRDEVLAQLPAELRKFAVRTSPLEELSALGCDAILDRRDAAVQLAQLARSSALLVPVDSSHHVFRWHTVMRDALRAELHGTDPELEGELHARASRWCMLSGEIERAAGHAAMAGDAEAVAEHLGRHSLDYLGRGRHRTVDQWLGALGGRVGEHPVLALVASMTALSRGAVDEARRWSETGVDGGSEEDCRRDAAIGLGVARAVAGANSAQAIREIAESALAALRPDSPWRAYCLALLGLSVHLTGDPAGGAALLDDAICAIGDRAPSVTALALSHRAMIAIEREELELSGELTDQAWAILTEWNLEREPLSALVFAAAAASRARRGRADEAKADLRRGLDLLTTLGEFRPWYGAETRILLAHASLWLADVVRARALLAEASRLARKVPDAVVFRGWFDAAWAHMDTIAETSLSGPSSLTIAELRVLRFLPSHRSFREIGAQLNVSGNTVKTQAHAVYRKLGVASRSEAVARAIESGILN